MVGISKEDVLNWYQGLNASHRVEIICALLDHSLPFELRFLGSVIENLGRKDFHVLRDAECRANSLHSSESIPDQAAILKLLSEGPAPMPMTSNIGNHHGVGSTISHSNNANETPAAAARPSQTQGHDKRTMEKTKVHSELVENGVCSKSSTPGSSSSESGSKESDKCHATVNHVELNSEEENESKKEVWLHDWTKRRKLILYLSLMAATNHDSANLYYILLSNVEDLMVNLDWLEELDEMVQDEILLLYTIGSHHPAFTFEQRTFLSAVLNRFKDCMARYSKPCGQNFQSPSPLNQIQILNHLMSQVVGQMQTSSSAPVHSPTTGVATHSISVNTPLLSYGGGHPQCHNSQAHNFPTYQTLGVSFGAMGAGTFRPNSQAPLLNRPTAFIPAHPSSLINNQMVMKQQQDQRNHTGGHVSLRQKNPSTIQNQNTPKRRTNTNPNVPIVASTSISCGNNISSSSNSIMSQPQGAKGEESNEMKDRTNNILVVSANPVKNSPQSQDNRGKIYHHPNSGFSNNGSGILELISSSSGCGVPSSSNSTSNPLINTPTGNPSSNIGNISTVSTGQVLHNTQPKYEDNMCNDGGILEYNVANTTQLPTYHSAASIYGHPGAGTTFIPVQNGFMTPSFYPNHVVGPGVGGMNSTGPHGPSTEILINPGHVQPQQYQFTFPFSIPPQHYGNPNLISKTICANNPVTKDSSKNQLPVLGAVGGSSDFHKLQLNANESGITFGRPNPPSNTQTVPSMAYSGVTNLPPSIPLPSHSPMSAPQSSRSRGVILEVGGQTPGADFPSLSSLENALMPDLDDPLEINNRPRKISCYNCGSSAHIGPECFGSTLEEMTRKQYRLNYGGPSDSKEGE